MDEEEPDSNILDAWLIWLIAIGAIILPVIVLICASSIPSGRLDMTDLHTATGRGDFLVPVLIMCTEAIRRWTREVSGGWLIRTGQILTWALCLPGAIVCFTATVIAATGATTAATSRSLVTITIGGTIIAAIFGTAGVSVGRA